VLEVIVARDIADVGEPDFTLEDVRADWAAPGVDLPADARVAADGDGRLEGYALVQGDDAIVLVHPRVEGRGLGTALREWAEGRARERGTAVVRQFVAGAEDSSSHRLLSGAGYTAVQRYFRMAGDLAELGSAGQVPGLRPFAPEDVAAVHALVQEGLSEVEGFVAQDLDAWRAKHLDRADAAPELWRVIEDEEGLVAAAVNERWPDGVGYVAELASARRARGQGYGRAALLASFDAFRGDGLERAVLSVHGANRNAARLYESAGMRVSWEARRWEKELARG
jgi:GNAT superfamily N-acetyltransferase